MFKGWSWPNADMDGRRVRIDYLIEAADQPAYSLMAAARSAPPTPRPFVAASRRMARHPFLRTSNGGCSKRRLRPDFLQASRGRFSALPGPNRCQRQPS